MTRNRITCVSSVAVGRANYIELTRCRQTDDTATADTMFVSEIFQFGKYGAKLLKCHIKLT
jgi:hypothetical protein